MITKLSNIIKGKETVLKNFVALGLLQGTNFIIPLLVMPYLVRVVGVDKFGIIALIQAVMVYFASLTDYGFTVSATRDVALHKGNSQKLNEIFNAVFSTKLILLLLAAILVAILAIVIPYFEGKELALLLGFTIVVGQTILPVWFFQGVEQMKYITYLNLVAKLFFTFLIFALIGEANEYYLALLFFGLGNVLSGLVGIWIVVKKFNIKIRLASFQKVSEELRNGWQLFLANISVVSYMNSNIIILGFFTSELITGYYSIVEKILYAMRQILASFLLASYPHICKLANQAHQKIVQFYKQMFVPFMFLFFIASLALFVYADEVVFFFSNQTETVISDVLRFMCFMPFIVGINIPAYQTLLAYKHEKTCSNVLIVGSVFNITLNLILAPIIGVWGTVYSVIITETIITIGLHLVLHKKYPEERIFI